MLPSCYSVLKRDTLGETLMFYVSMNGSRLQLRISLNKHPKLYIALTLQDLRPAVIKALN